MSPLATARAKDSRSTGIERFPSGRHFALESLRVDRKALPDVLSDIAHERILDSLLESANHRIGERRWCHLRWRHGLKPFGIERPEEYVQYLDSARAQFRAHALRCRQTRRLGRGIAPICGPVHQRMDRQQIDER